MSFTIKTIDHVALHVQDLEKSIWFYKEVLRLHQKARPAFDFDGAWFAVGTQEIHLIAGRKVPVVSHSRGTHFAMQVDSIPAFIEYASLLWPHIDTPKKRPDGVPQLFITDPDGHRVELTMTTSSSTSVL